MGRPTLEFWFEFASTYSYPAAFRVDEVANASGVAVVWRPFLLGPIFKSQGWDTSPFNIYETKGRYMWRDIERTCARYRLPYKRPTVMPQNGLAAARVACCFDDAPWMREFVRQMYQANFVHNLDISSVNTLGSVLEALDVDADATFAAASTDASKAKLRVQTERAVELGIFGSPTFVAGEELFWGHDRLEEAVEWAANR